jgi:predicted PurR-regulated permease PerM
MSIDNDAPRERPAPASWFGVLVSTGVCLAVVLRVLEPFVSVLLLALVAAGIIYPHYRRLVRALNGRRHLAAAIVCALLLVMVLAPLYIVAQDASGEALGFYQMSTTELTEQTVLQELQRRQDQIDKVNAYLQPMGIVLTSERISDWLTSIGVRVGAFFYKQGVSIAKGLVRFVIGFVVWVLVLFYLLADGPFARAWFLESLPIPPDEQGLLVDRFTEMSASLVIGNGVAGIIQGVAGGMVFAVVGLPGPVLWGAVMGILAFIPVIGISFVFIPAFLILLIAGQTAKAFTVLVSLAIVATVVEYWLKPMIVGRRAQVHPILVFLSLIGGLIVYGAVGILIGPLMMTAFLTLVSIYHDNYRPFLSVPQPAPMEPPSDPEDEGGALSG